MTSFPSHKRQRSSPVKVDKSKGSTHIEDRHVKKLFARRHSFARVIAFDGLKKSFGGTKVWDPRIHRNASTCIGNERC